jgi:FkbM family methyltransferase
MIHWFGILRSLVIYWRPGRQKRLQEFYAPFVGADDLVFDIGAHLGDRSAAFAALGARVIALEPQPHLVPWLRRLTAKSGRVKIRVEAIGAAPGNAQLAVSVLTPTVSTVAAGWRHRMSSGHPGFRGVQWGHTLQVRVTTLDDLVATYGEPTFCKIDVEGAEAEALAGLSRSIEALSIEFVRGAEDIALACVDRLEELAQYQYNAVQGEAREFMFDEWVDAPAMRAWLAEGAGGVSSGDLYARRVTLA